MNILELEHKAEAMQSAAERNLNTNTLLAFMIPGIWECAVQIARLTEAVARAGEK